MQPINSKTIQVLITIPSHCSLRGVIEDPLSYFRKFIPSDIDNEVEEIIFREIEKEKNIFPSSVLENEATVELGLSGVKEEIL